MILVTGSAGLVGGALIARLEQAGHAVRRFDLREDRANDVRDARQLAAAVRGVTGVVHFAAVSRVVWAQRDPQLTTDTNVTALGSLLRLCGMQTERPWVIFASSREVYGEQHALPVAETAPLGPLNVYARSKVAGEELTWQARGDGLLTNVVRLSNVYGTTDDHVDRVVPAFARAAAFGLTVGVEGAENMFDFTHIDDVAIGLEKLVEATIAGERLPAIHLLTGAGTTLRELAALASAYSKSKIRCEDRPARSYDVSRFVGDPALAERLLGWRSQISIADGFAALADDFAAQPIEIAAERVASRSR